MNMRNLKAAALISSLLPINSVTLKAQRENIDVGGKQRTIETYAPKDLPKGRPLLIYCHGMGMDINSAKGSANFAPIADTAKFLVVYPQGIYQGVDEYGTNCFNGWDIKGTTDTEFMKAIIDLMHTRYGIDLDRVYMSGFSMGGMLTQYCADMLSDQIAAFASVSGYQRGGPKYATTRAVPIMHVHGDADPVVKYNTEPNFYGAMQTQQGWATHNHCGDMQESHPNDRATKYEWKGGDCGAEVVLYKLAGVQHAHTNNQGQLHTSQEIWRFVSRFGLKCQEGQASGAAGDGAETEEPETPQEKVFGMEAGSLTIEAEEMPGRSGTYTGEYHGAFDGMAYYGNDDCTTAKFTVSEAGEQPYCLKVSGCSNNGKDATVMVLIDGKEIGALTWAAVQTEERSLEVELKDGSVHTLKLQLVQDDGSSDLYLDKVEIDLKAPEVAFGKPDSTSRAIAGRSFTVSWSCAKDLGSDLTLSWIDATRGEALELATGLKATDSYTGEIPLSFGGKEGHYQLAKGTTVLATSIDVTIEEYKAGDRITTADKAAAYAVEPGQITIFAEDAEGMSAFLTDQLGRKVAQEAGGKIATQGLAKGVYILTLGNGTRKKVLIAN